MPIKRKSTFHYLKESSSFFVQAERRGLGPKMVKNLFTNIKSFIFKPNPQFTFFKLDLSNIENSIKTDDASEFILHARKNEFTT